MPGRGGSAEYDKWASDFGKVQQAFNQYALAPWLALIEFFGNPSGVEFTDVLRQGPLGPGGRVGEKGGEDVVKALQWGKYMVAMNDCFGLLAVMEDAALRNEIKRAKGRLLERLHRMDFKEFRRTWASARQLIGLQARLFMEQAFWELGDPWRALLTGFDPVDTSASVSGAGVAASTVGTATTPLSNVGVGSPGTSGGGPNRWTRVRRV